METSSAEEPGALGLDSKASAASLDMQRVQSEVPSWLTNHKVWWRHPVARICVVWNILLMDMILFGEDPVNDSHVEANLPGLGHLYSLYTAWPKSGGLMLFRLVLVVACLLAGCIIGRQQIHHRLLRDRWRLFMFADNMGSWMVMAVTCGFTSLIGVAVWNVLMLALGDPMLSSAMGMEMNDFAKLAQTCSVFADLVAIIMVTDAVLQDQVKYPNWAKGLKKRYREGLNGWLRVVLVWVVAAVAAVVVPLGIHNSGKGHLKWDDRTVGGLTEVARAALVSVICFCDLFTVVQDWDFPTFQSGLDIPLDKQVFVAGTFGTELRCNGLLTLLRRCRRLLPDVPVPAFARRLYDELDPGFFCVRVSGAWLTYGPLIFVVCLDLFCTRTQLVYDPETYGQYVSRENQHVWAVVDEEFLRSIYKDGVLTDPTALSWDARRLPDSPWNDDEELNSRYLGSALKYIAAAPGLVSIPTFWLLVWAANRKPELLQKMEALRVLKELPGGVDRWGVAITGTGRGLSHMVQKMSTSGRQAARTPQPAAALEDDADQPKVEEDVQGEDALGIDDGEQSITV